MLEFYINQNSTNPSLRVELIKDGRYTFNKFNNAIQDSVVTFYMKDRETDILKISGGPVNVLESAESGCEEKIILEYKWTPRDVKNKGIYQGWFNIQYNGDIYEAGMDYPDGNLIVPIQEDLIIYIR